MGGPVAKDRNDHGDARVTSGQLYDGNKHYVINLLAQDAHGTRQAHE
jgi:hypothetical protein